MSSLLERGVIRTTQSIMWWWSRVAVTIILKTWLFLSSLHCSNNNEENADDLFRVYIEKYHKPYIPSTDEYSERLTNFKESLKRIELLNKQRNHSGDAWYGITEYSDLTPEQFKKLVSKEKDAKTNIHVHSPLVRRATDESDFMNLPKHVDWRDKKVITPVKDQKKCGACWAFSTVETIETMYALKTGKLEELSVQQIIDCAGGSNHGCDGGDGCEALNWISSNKIHIVTEKEYPLTDKTGECKFRNPPKGVQIAPNHTCDNFVNNEIEMLRLLSAHGPLAVAVDATTWQDYLGGIIQYHCEDNMNHAVQIVGYDFTGDVPYYIVRNSWGSQFGNQGYLFIAYGRNLCGIAIKVSRVDVI